MDNKGKTVLSRRDFLKYAGVAGISAVGVSYLDMYRPWVDTDRLSRLSDKELSKMDNKLELIRLATLAASSHNSQPWKFKISGETIQIIPDYSRRLTVVDPDDRELWISLGCALENLLIAAGSHGYSYEVDYPENEEQITVWLGAERVEPPVKNGLYDAIFQRQNTRSMYVEQENGIEVKMDIPPILELEPGINLQYANNPKDMAVIGDFVKRGTVAQYSSKPFVDELNHWLRFNKKEALNSMDGLYSRCSGNPEVPRFIGEMFVNSSDPEKMAEVDAKRLQSAMGSLIITSDRDARSSWVRTGQVYERWALTMTGMGYRSSMLNQPIEVPEVRRELTEYLAVDSNYPQLLVRFGNAQEMPRSQRRPVSQVMI